ncbi:MAG: hypothetical protein AAF532_01955 [Planctomycetota bacterium]
MIKFAQVLSVGVAVISLLFMALMIVVSTGGPNWQAIADDIDDYSFEPVATDIVRWEVVHRVTGTAIVTADTLPGAIVAALNDLDTRLANETVELEETIEAVRAQSDRVEEFREIDGDGIERGLALVRSQIEQIEAETVRLTADGKTAAERATATREVVDARRADVARLGSALSHVRAQQAAYMIQNDRLVDRLTRIRGELDRATARRELLTGG